MSHSEPHTQDSGLKSIWPRVIQCQDKLQSTYILYIRQRIPVSIVPLKLFIAVTALRRPGGHHAYTEGLAACFTLRSRGSVRVAQVKSWSCTHVASIRFLLMETRMFGAPEGGEIIEPGGVSPGVTRRTGEPILSSPRMGAASHRPGREGPGVSRGRRAVSPFSGLGSFFAMQILGAHAPSFTMSPLRGCEDHPVA